jgi:arylsulfatase A-like enzyme
VAQFILAACSTGFLLAQGTDERTPNFVIILSDDQGWNATSTQVDSDIPESGSSYYRTPNLDRLISQGICFSRAYSSSPTCGPSRHSIQFGRSPVSLGIFASSTWGLESFAGVATESMANTLKKARPTYATAHFGKWHVRVKPDELGYDVSDGAGGNTGGNSDDPADPKLIFSLTKKGNEFMEKQVKAGKPFFLQISHYANHKKYQARPEITAKYEDQYAGDATKYQNSALWAAMNEDLDTGVGMTLAKIKELGIEDNTYVIFTSDNGYEGKLCQKSPVNERVFYKAYPLVSHKYTINEGGLRVPFIVRGPGIPAGIKSRTRVVGHDIFPTVLEIIGHKDRIPTSVDGASLWDHLRSGGKQQVARKEPHLVFRYTRDAPDVCIIQDGFKLLKELNSGKMHLWDLNNDLGEQKNLIEQHPEKATRMHTALTAHLQRHGWDESMAVTGQELKELRKGHAKKNDR